MSGDDHHIEAVIEDYLRNRWGSPLESVPFRYKKTKTLNQSFSKLIHEWANITQNHADPGSPHYAEVKKEIDMLDSSSPTAKGMNELMQPIKENIAKLKDVVSLDHFSVDNCILRAQNMKSHTAPGASGVSIDYLRILPRQGWAVVSAIFKGIIRTGIFPESFRLGLVTILNKKAGTKGTVNNIRPITVLDSMYRLFTNIIQTSCAQLFHEHNIIPPEQHACLIGRGPMSPLLMLNTVLEHALDNTPRMAVGTLVQVYTETTKKWTNGKITKLHYEIGRCTVKTSHCTSQKNVKYTHIRPQTHATDKQFHGLITDMAACYDSVPYVTVQLCVSRLGLPPEFLKLVRGMQTGQYRSLKIGIAKADLSSLEGGWHKAMD